MYRPFVGYFNRARSLRFGAVRSKVLQGASGILHVGAHFGQEAKRYDRLNLPVIWVEGNPETHAVLVERLAPFPMQQSKLGLVGRENREAADFYIANNEGGSSSIYPFSPGSAEENKIGMAGSRQIPMVRLNTLVSERERSGASLIGYLMFREQNWRPLSGREAISRNARRWRLRSVFARFTREVCSSPILKNG